MTYNPVIHHRRSIRLHGYDYSQSGAYFVTICSFQKIPIFCTITDGVVQPSSIGQIIIDVWQEMLKLYQHVKCDNFILMPNHIHAIVEIEDHEIVETLLQGAINCAPALGQIVRAFKAKCSWNCTKNGLKLTHPLWQRNYYEHIIRNHESYEKIAYYIATNPLRWIEDKYYA